MIRPSNKSKTKEKKKVNKQIGFYQRREKKVNNWIGFHHRREKPVSKKIGFYHRRVKISEQTERFLSQKGK